MGWLGGLVKDGDEGVGRREEVIRRRWIGIRYWPIAAILSYLSVCAAAFDTTAHGDYQRKANRELRFSAHVSSSFCYAVFSVQCSVAGAARLPS
jgi:hypothetical protein